MINAITSTSLALLIALGLLSCSYSHLSPGASNEKSDDQLPFDWETIAPTVDLSKWANCYNRRQCARLMVPLNYSEPRGISATVALVRVPAKQKGTKYLGPVLINPGGPGGSGVELVAGHRGESLARILGPRFDIVGFDPRGVGRSTPRASFFDTDAERAVWGPPIRDAIQPHREQDGVPYAYARALVTSRLARKHGDDVFAHINTPNTARDMLQIAIAHGRKKVQYWGFSYGSVLGATFAAMFPDRIERMVIDGILDAENYYATEWSNNLLDTNKTLQAFFDGCFDAGPKRCAFWAPSPLDIAQNLTSLYDSIRARPIPAHSGPQYGVVEYSAMKKLVLLSLYSPYNTFSALAEGLAGLARGDGALFEQYQDPRFECCSPDREARYAIRDAAKVILCTDGAPVDDTPSELRTFYKQMAALSDFAEVWTFRLGCVGWPFPRADPFAGPFVGNTSYPLLVIGNTADPVSPLWAAHKMAAGFDGAVVLTQDSPGHTSFSGPSLCTQKHVRRYFLDGALPPVGTVCEVPAPLFPSEGAHEMIAEGLSVDDRELLDAVLAMSLTRPFQPVFSI